eukprot:m.199898 g.199898  ORF g.199898 m.199898 type:complete len:546 (-) comp20901_c0_seq1:247-1884(-)
MKEFAMRVWTIGVGLSLHGAHAAPPWPELAATPPMGWNGWLPTTRGLIPGYENNETMYYAAADILVSSGLRDAGYDTVLVTCAGWQRDPTTHKLVENPIMWPRGYKAYIDYLHERGLKIGAYGDTGEFNCCETCAGGKCWHEPGQLGYEELDVQTWADMGVDHIVIDNCDNANTSAQSVFEYQRIKEALVKVNKPMIFGIWDVGSGKSWSWATDVGHYWRTGPDLGTRWGNDDVMSIMLNYDLEQAIPSLDSISGPGSFAFLDNLAVGLPKDVPHAGDTGLTLDEAYTHFGIWCIMASPLILNHNIFPGPHAVDPNITKLIMNKDAIGINQDPLGKSAVRIDGARTWTSVMHRLPLNNPETMWRNGEQLAKPLANGDVAVLLFNRLNDTMDLVLNFEDVGNTSLRCWDVYDIWTGQDLGRYNMTFNATAVASHASRFLRLSNGAICQAPPPPPPAPQPPCPAGYETHAGGYWHNTDPCNGTFAKCKEDSPSTMDHCASRCNASADCVGFNLYWGETTACYIYHKVTQDPFTPNADCVTCLKVKAP